MNVQGVTLKCSHAYGARRAFLNQQAGPEQCFQHILKQGHLAGMQVCVRETQGGEEVELGDSDGV